MRWIKGTRPASIDFISDYLILHPNEKKEEIVANFKQVMENLKDDFFLWICLSDHIENEEPKLLAFILAYRSSEFGVFCPQLVTTDKKNRLLMLKMAQKIYLWCEDKGFTEIYGQTQHNMKVLGRHWGIEEVSKIVRLKVNDKYLERLTAKLNQEYKHGRR